MKVGVLTHYYNSTNYGGILQAYALVHFLKNRGYDAEQICYAHSDFSYASREESIALDEIRDKNIPVNAENIKVKMSFQLLKEKLCWIFDRIWDKAKFGIYSFQENFRRKKREQAFQRFKQSIPHSKNVYDYETISSVGDNYDIFITGSDQVFNFRWFNPAFFLSFPTEGKKIGYAVSAGTAEFNSDEKKYLKTVLKEFSSISAREKDLADSLSEICGKEVKNVLDPVFLLSKNEWDKIAEKRIVQNKYVFLFFLSDDVRAKTVAVKVAYEMGAVPVIIPNLSGKSEFDNSFKGKKVHNPTPEQFLSLIRDAAFVITDSFHATAFSIIFHKQFYTFARKRFGGMSSRLTSLLDIFNCPDHYCDASSSVDEKQILSVKSVDYTIENKKYLEDYTESVNYILNAL